MKILAALILSCVSSIAMAADYTVGIVANTGHGRPGIRLYETTSAGITVVQTYVLYQQTAAGLFVTPLTLAVNPQHTFVYVVYTSPVYSEPNLFGFKITSTGLVLQWEQPIATGDYEMQTGYLVAGPNYVMEILFPSGPWITVLTQSGQRILEEEGDVNNYISSSIDSAGALYYSCRGSIPSNDVVGVAPLPITSVSVYKFVPGTTINNATPVVTSTDPAYIESVCAP
jgi:hypothetical protein